MSEHTISLVRFSDPYATCTTCRAAARWMVDGTTACDRHIHIWAERHADRRERESIVVGGR